MHKTLDAVIKTALRVKMPHRLLLAFIFGLAGSVGVFSHRLFCVPPSFDPDGKDTK